MSTTFRNLANISGALVVLMAAILNTSATVRAAEAEKSAATLFKFPTATFPVDTYATDFVGKDRGIFEKHGLDVTFTYPPSGATAAQLLLAGEIRGWNGPMDYAIQAAAKGADLKIAGMPFPTTTDYIIVSTKESWPDRNAPYEEKVKALRGKTIGVSGIGAGTDHILIAVLNSLGMTDKDVNRVGVGTSAGGLGQLQAGRIDAYVDFSKSGVHLMESKGAGKLYINLGLDKDVPWAVQHGASNALIVGGKFAKERPDIVAAYVAAQREAIEFIKAHPDESAKIIAQYVFKGEHEDWIRDDLGTLIDLWNQSLSGLAVSKAVYANWVKLLDQQGYKVSSSPTAAYDEVVLPLAREK
jgi:ABC-type nitrate/sulfonate/bicarbonate transport system substrate-binding protein